MPLVIIVNITDDEKNYLLNDLLDINSWVQKAVTGKINNVKKRLIREWYPKFIADPAIVDMPADEQLFLSAIFAHPDYKNRLARDAKGIS